MGERPYGPMHIIIIRIISYQHITRKKTQEKEKKFNNKTNQVMSYCWLKRKVMCHIKREDSFSPSKSFPIKKKIQINQYISLKFHPSSSSSIRKNFKRSKWTRKTMNFWNDFDYIIYHYRPWNFQDFFLIRTKYSNQFL